jgi:hypothetical protein
VWVQIPPFAPMTTVVNKRTDTYDVYIGRGSPFGNQWTHIKGNTLAQYVVATREESIAEFKKDFLKRVETDQEFREQVLSLKGKRLGCFCKPLACHGDVIKEWLDKQT